MEQRPVQVSICIFLLSIVGFACMDSAMDSESAPAVIEGRVESVSVDDSDSAQTQDVEAAVVTAAKVAGGDSLETIGGAEAETGSQGEFTLEIPGGDMETVETVSRIVVVAQSDEGTGKTFVTSNIQSGSAVQAKPITLESTAEAVVLQKVIANGEEGMVANADIEAAVDTEVAESITDNPDVATDLAVVLANQYEIKTEFYDREGVEVEEGRQDDIDEIKRNAQIDLENRLHDLGDSEEEQDKAFDDFLETMANAELEAGIEASDAAKASKLASLLIVNGDLELSDEAEAEFYRNSSYKTAAILDVAVRNQLEALGAQSGTVNIAEDAGDNLQSEISAGTEPPADEISSLYVDYRNEVVTGIENDASVDGAAFSTVNDIIGGEGGAKAAFDSMVEGISDPGIIVEAYTQFNSDVRSTANSGIDEEDSENIEAYSELLILLNIVS